MLKNPRKTSLQSMPMHPWKAGVIELFKTPLHSLRAIVLLSLFLVLPVVLWIMSDNFQQASHTPENSPKITLYLSPEISEEETQTLKSQIEHSSEVAKVIVISKEQGLNELGQQLHLGEEITNRQVNPLPTVIKVWPATSLNSTAQVSQLVQSLQALPHVHLAQINMDLVKRQYDFLEFWQELVYVCSGLFIGAFLVCMFIVMQNFSLTQMLPNRAFYYLGSAVGLFAALLASLGVVIVLDVLADPVQEWLGIQGAGLNSGHFGMLLALGVSSGLASALLTHKN